MIPKRIFFYWGGSKLSWMRYMTLYSFRKYNPKWEMILYYTKENDVKNKTWKESNMQDFCSYNGLDYFHLIENLNITVKDWELKNNTIIDTNLSMGPSHVSNFLKWSKLHEEGGIYSDLDILYFRPIENFYNTLINGNFDTAICQTEYLSIGLLASKKDNPFFKDIFINGTQKFNPDMYQSAGVINIYNLYRENTTEDNRSHIMDRAKNRYPNLNFYNIPMNLIYFLDSWKIDYAIEQSLDIIDFPTESIGYHWYAGHPHIQYYNNLLTDENYKRHDITFTKLAKRILEI